VFDLDARIYLDRGFGKVCMNINLPHGLCYPSFDSISNDDRR